MANLQIIYPRAGQGGFFFCFLIFCVLYLWWVQMVKCVAQKCHVVCGISSTETLLRPARQFCWLWASQLQVAFADCAADIKSTYESQDGRQAAPEWPANSLNSIAVLFLRAGRTQEAWWVQSLKYIVAVFVSGSQRTSSLVTVWCVIRKMSFFWDCKYWLKRKLLEDQQSINVVFKRGHSLMG